MDEPEACPRQARRLQGDTGANLVEYSLLLALILIVCLSAVTVFGSVSTAKVSCVSSVIVGQVSDARC